MNLALPTSLHPAVVIGGTGMLHSVTTALAVSRPVVTVIARRASGLAAVAKTTAGRIHPLPLDYTEPGALAAGMRVAAKNFGSPDLIVAWLHDDGLFALPETVAFLHAKPHSRLFLVRSSAIAGPDFVEPVPVVQTRQQLGDRFREVILGWMVSSSGARWLSNEEIAAAVITAIACDAVRHVAWCLQPWTDRP